MKKKKKLSRGAHPRRDLKRIPQRCSSSPYPYTQNRTLNKLIGKMILVIEQYYDWADYRKWRKPLTETTWFCTRFKCTESGLFRHRCITTYNVTRFVVKFYLNKLLLSDLLGSSDEFIAECIYDGFNNTKTYIEKLFLFVWVIRTLFLEIRMPIYSW